MFVTLLFSKSWLLTKHKHERIGYINSTINYATWFKIVNVVHLYIFRYKISLLLRE